MSYILGHDGHGHHITSTTGCSGTITIPPNGEHDAAANVFGVFDAEYTDNGAITVHTQHTLQPRHRQAEHFATSSGVQRFDKASAEGGRTVGEIHNGDWIAFHPYALSGATSFTARVSSGGTGGTLSLRAGSPTGPILGSAPVPVTDGWDVFTTVSGTLSGTPAATTVLYLVCTGSGTGALFDLDSFTLTGGSEPPPGRVEAESFSSQSGTQTVDDPGAHGGVRVGYIDNGDWLGFASVTVTGRTAFTARVASGGPGGTIQIRANSPTGPILGSVSVPPTGGYDAFVDVATALNAGTGTLFLTFTGSGGGLFDVDDFALTPGGQPATNLARDRPTTDATAWTTVAQARGNTTTSPPTPSPPLTPDTSASSS